MLGLATEGQRYTERPSEVTGRWRGCCLREGGVLAKAGRGTTLRAVEREYGEMVQLLRGGMVVWNGHGASYRCTSWLETLSIDCVTCREVIGAGTSYIASV
jgi:hypothetical protein